MFLPSGKPTGYSARGTMGVFLEEVSAAADADFRASPRQSRGVLHTNKALSAELNFHANSDASKFLKDEPDLYTTADLKKRYGSVHK